MLKSMLIAGAGGFIGTSLRYLVGVFVKQWFNGSFPLGTFIVNIFGCLIIGIVFGIAEKTGALRLIAGLHKALPRWRELIQHSFLSNEMKEQYEQLVVSRLGRIQVVSPL